MPDGSLLRKWGKFRQHCISPQRRVLHIQIRVRTSGRALPESKLDSRTTPAEKVFRVDRESHWLTSP